MSSLLFMFLKLQTGLMASFGLMFSLTANELQVEIEKIEVEVEQLNEARPARPQGKDDTPRQKKAEPTTPEAK